MTTPSHRSAYSFNRLFSAALFLVLCVSFQFASAGLDKGSFDLRQSPSGPPEAWAWCKNSTSDGNGVEFIAYLSSFEHAGAASPSVTTTANFHSGVAHQDLQGFVNWIVANNAHVTSSAQLTIVRRDVSLVTLP